MTSGGSKGRLRNVKSDIRNKVAQDQLAAELSGALLDLFEITSHRRFRSFNAEYVGMYALPTKTVRDSLLIEREVFVLVANFATLHARTLTVCVEAMKAEQPRLQPDLTIVMHADPDGDEQLRVWAREAGITVLPIYRPTAGAMPPATVVRQRLARELFTSDSFQVTGPVSDDTDFFGRREQASDLLRQLKSGRIAALFGLRKVGKTSMLNRIIDLASAQGQPRVAMIDCSLRGFSELSADAALKAVARVSRLAADQGYAHISQALRRDSGDLMETFEGLWSTSPGKSLLIVFDEVDYITPESPTASHWEVQFNDFWREFRALIQETRRHDVSVGVLVSGVSSRSFRLAEIGGVENSVLHFVPEDYLTPFAPGAADAMISALGKRCGLAFSANDRELIARTAAYLPYWIRMAGSFIHRRVDVDERPVTLESTNVADLCHDFAQTEGAEISRVAIQNLRRVDPAMYEVLLQCAAGDTFPLRNARPLLQYGLVRQRGDKVFIESEVVRRGLDLLLSQDAHPLVDEAGIVTASRSLDLDEGEWAEELASINRRRNILERKTREFIRVALRMGIRDRPWADVVRASLSTRRREECAALVPDALMGKLYWIELCGILTREWAVFESFFNDKRRLQSAFNLLNERPDAHAKDVDLADIALQRRELDWLEERIAQ